MRMSFVCNGERLGIMMFVGPFVYDGERSIGTVLDVSVYDGGRGDNGMSDEGFRRSGKSIFSHNGR
jgi:hypothetical protein